MASPLVPILVSSLIGVPLVLYKVFLGLCCVPAFQRHLLYSHKFHTLWWKNINDPEQWGFAKNQVTPFHITTPDNQTLYAWHVLPVPTYAQHEATLAAQPTGLVPDITTTENFRLLRDDPSAKLIISFHGNAAQLTQGIRPTHYHTLTAHPNHHLLTLDYRGFGLSTGTPTEAGLIADARAAISWAVHTAGIPASRIVLVGHSLGTAVTAAAVESFTLHEGEEGGWDFAGVVLVAGFSSLAELLGAGEGVFGLLVGPLVWWPWLRGVVMKKVVDRWESAGRWRAVVDGVRRRGGRLSLGVVHARDDWNVPCRGGEEVFRAAVEGLVGREMGEGEFEREKKRRVVVRGKYGFVAAWREGDVEIRQELVPHGGHNSILAYNPVVLAVLRAFGNDDETASSSIGEVEPDSPKPAEV